MASARLTGESSVSQDEQQYSRPQRPTPESRAASSRTPICRSSMRVRNMRGEVADQRAEVDPLLGGEVDRELVAVPLPLGVAHLHHQARAPAPARSPCGGRRPPSDGSRRACAASSRRGAADAPAWAARAPPRRPRRRPRSRAAAAALLRRRRRPRAVTRPRSRPRSASTMTASPTRSGVLARPARGSTPCACP